MKTILGVMTMGLLVAPMGLAFAAGDDYMPTYIESASGKKIEKIAAGMGPETFQFKDRLAEQRVENWNKTMGMVSRAYDATPFSANTIAENAYTKDVNAQQIVNTVAKYAQMAQNFGNTNTPNSYVPNSDGSVTISQNGLPVMIQNKPVRDQFGNISRQTITMKYDENRLMTDSETTTTDPLGNVSHLSQHFTWTADSKWYANQDTNAYKNILSLVSVETDQTGRTVTTEYHGLQFDGKFTRAYSQSIHDSVYGDSSFTRYNIQYNGNDTTKILSYDEDGIEGDTTYTLHRSNLTYNDRDQLLGYHEEKRVTNLDGSITVISTDAQFTYNEVTSPYGKDIDGSTIPNQLATSTVTSTVTNADGSTRTTTDTMKYDYTNNTLTGAVGTTIFSGREADWIQYTDTQGHVLTVEQDNGVLKSAWYVDADGNKVSVALDQVQAALKPGERYEGSTITQYEVVGITPLAKDSTTTTSYFDQVTGLAYRTEQSTAHFTNGLVNNTARVLSTQEHTISAMPLIDPDQTHLTVRDITTTYSYDANGILTGDGAHGTGTGFVWQYSTQTGWQERGAVTIDVTYQLFYGKPEQTLYQELPAGSSTATNQ